MFDSSYQGNPLVNALCAGAMRVEDLHLAFASGAGNKIILFGARTGLDGIGGVSVLASETFDDSAGGRPKKLPAVQVGDPFTEKVLIECCLDLYREKLVVGIRISVAPAVLRDVRAGGGRRRRHAHRPRPGPDACHRDDPAEVLSSESQERMCAVVAPENVDAFMEVCKKWDVLATVIGEVTDGEHLVIDWHGETVVDAPANTIAHEARVRAPGRAPRHAGRADRRQPLRT